MHGANRLGSVHIYAGSATETDSLYPRWNKFSDEGDKGLTQAGLSRLSFTASWERRLMRVAVFLLKEGGRKKPRAGFWC